MFLIVGGFIPFFSYAIFALTLSPLWLIFASILGGVGLAGGLGVAMNSTALLPLLAGTATDRNRTQAFWYPAGGVDSRAHYRGAL